MSSLPGVIPGSELDPLGLLSECVRVCSVEAGFGSIPQQVPSASTRCWLVPLNAARCRSHLLAADT